MADDTPGHMVGVDCEAMLARLSEYVDGELPAGLCEEIRGHLDHCPPCDRLCDTLRRTIELCRRLPAPAVPEDARTEIRTLLARLAGGPKP